MTPVLALIFPLLAVVHGKEVFAFVPPVSPNVYRTFDWDKLTTVVWFHNPVDAEFVKFAHSNGVKVQKLASDISPKVFLNSDRQAGWVAEELSEVRKHGLDGLNFDYEGPIRDKSPEQEGYLNLTRATFDAFSPLGLQVSMDVAWSPGCIDGRCFPISAMAPFLNHYFIMAYDERGQIFGPCVAGPNSDIRTTIQGVNEYLALGVPSEKLILGVPWYGRDYPCIHFNPKTELCDIAKIPFRGVPCSDSPGTERDYADLAKQMAESGVRPGWLAPAKSPWFNYRVFLSTALLLGAQLAMWDAGVGFTSLERHILIDSDTSRSLHTKFMEKKGFQISAGS